MGESQSRWSTGLSAQRYHAVAISNQTRQALAGYARRYAGWLIPDEFAIVFGHSYLQLLDLPLFGLQAQGHFPFRFVAHL